MGNYPTLPYLNANEHTVTLSGHGDGCAMAQRFSIIYSGRVAGAAFFNCWPYGVDYDTELMGTLTEDELFEISKAAIEAASLAGDINDTSFIA